jgi:6-phosphogluconate dehydrogenase
VVKIVEEALDKREGKGKSKDEPKAAFDLDAFAKKIGECIEGALDRHAAKQVEARAKAEKEKAEAEKKAEEERKATEKKREQDLFGF